MFRTLAITLSITTMLTLAAAPDARAQYAGGGQAYGNPTAEGMSTAQEREMAKRAAKMEQRLNSMSPEQRAYFEQVAKEKLGALGSGLGSGAGAVNTAEVQRRHTPSAARQMGTRTRNQNDTRETAASPDVEEVEEEVKPVKKRPVMSTGEPVEQTTSIPGHMDDTGKWVPTQDSVPVRNASGSSGYRDGSVPMRSKSSGNGGKKKVNIIN